MFRAPAFLCLLALGLHAVARGESLFDDDEVEEFKKKQDEGSTGESLFDEDEVSQWKGNSEDETEERAADEIQFDEKGLTKVIHFDDKGNVLGGGTMDPNITFWHVSEFNGVRYVEPTQGSGKLMEAIENDESYDVWLAPPSLHNFKCTEKVEMIEQVFGRPEFEHDVSHDVIQRALSMLQSEGVTNTKQLGELHEKDYDGLAIPALLKSRLRPVREEARKQSAVANGEIAMDGDEVAAELKEFMDARQNAKGGDAANAPNAAEVVPGEPVVEQEDEDGTFKSLVWAVMNCPTCKGKETIACFRTCRYGGLAKAGRPWGECLDECIENRWLRATFWAMLPRS